MNKIIIDNLIDTIINEDLLHGDITTDSIVPENLQYKAVIIAKEPGIISGLDVAEKLFIKYDNSVIFNKTVNEGDNVKSQTDIAELSGSAKSILICERPALNIIGHMSGIASLTGKFVDIARKYNVTICDTRKTMPGLRMIEKYAVRMGGGRNHRFGLYDAVLIKDNHIKVAGSITKAVNSVRQNVGHTIKIEVESANIEDVKESLTCNVDIIMLDNMSLRDIEESVKIINKKAIVEVSGNMTLDRIEEVCRTGIDVISTGTITHSAKSLDVSLNIK